MWIVAGLGRKKCAIVSAAPGEQRLGGFVCVCKGGGTSGGFLPLLVWINWLDQLGEEVEVRLWSIARGVLRLPTQRRSVICTGRNQSFDVCRVG